MSDSQKAGVGERGDTTWKLLHLYDHKLVTQVSNGDERPFNPSINILLNFLYYFMDTTTLETVEISTTISRATDRIRTKICQ
uniref:Uncharacterized protein n=1 Tax=Heterorhabditis bacteriophora TaxID=37862 RepID=A0A1I7WAT8_HETBA